MSFHSPASDVSRLNTGAHLGSVTVSAHTLAALKHALTVARLSDGVFDPTVAPLAVRRGELPRPVGAPEPDPRASWRDLIVDESATAVRFLRPLWIDLGGIAKGYAVDLACGTLRARGMTQACVNAGGDLAVVGQQEELVLVDPGPGCNGARPVLRLANGALASSGRPGERTRRATCRTHVDGSARRRAPAGFASVVASRCVDADPLTKVVLARAENAEPVLESFGASAVLWTRAGHWQWFGAAR